MKKTTKKTFKRSSALRERGEKTLNLARLKAEVLCYGLNVTDESILAKAREQNPFQEVRAGPGFGWYITLGGRVFLAANISFQGNRNSPFYIEQEGEVLWLMRDQRPLTTVQPLDPPDWYFERTSSGIEMGRLFQQHGKNALTTAVYANCSLFGKGEECKYCRIGETDGVRSEDASDIIKVKPALDLAETVARALDSNPDYQVTLNGGMTYSDGRGFELFIPVVDAIRQKAPSVPIMVEESPPNDPSFMQNLRDSGANVLMMNLEIYDEELREMYCPGKSRLMDRETYFERLEQAVGIYGVGNVSSCLIAGLEPTNSTLEGANRLLSIGVVPSIMPYRRLTDKMPEELSANPEELVAINRAISKDIALLAPEQQAGCVGCTGCSVEVNYAKE